MNGGKKGLVYDLKSVVETGMTGMLFYTSKELFKHDVSTNFDADSRRADVT